jgi:hypothetical protein
VADNIYRDHIKWLSLYQNKHFNFTSVHRGPIPRAQRPKPDQPDRLQLRQRRRDQQAGILGPDWLKHSGKVVTYLNAYSPDSSKENNWQ